jgi:hypothetical protein
MVKWHLHLRRGRRGQDLRPKTQGPTKLPIDYYLVLLVLVAVVMQHRTFLVYYGF